VERENRGHSENGGMLKGQGEGKGVSPRLGEEVLMVWGKRKCEVSTGKTRRGKWSRLECNMRK